MGNRAIVKFNDSIGIYLHWNGGPESIGAFLEEAQRRKLRTFESDPTYAVAGFVQIVREFFSYASRPDHLEYSLSCGVGNPSSMDDSDNGVYEIRHGWKCARATVGSASIAEFFQRLEAAHLAFMTQENT
jgi:hypothetical protein